MTRDAAPRLLARGAGRRRPAYAVADQALQSLVPFGAVAVQGHLAERADFAAFVLVVGFVPLLVAAVRATVTEPFLIEVGVWDPRPLRATLRRRALVVAAVAPALPLAAAGVIDGRAAPHLLGLAAAFAAVPLSEARRSEAWGVGRPLGALPFTAMGSVVWTTTTAALALAGAAPILIGWAPLVAHHVAVAAAGARVGPPSGRPRRQSVRTHTRSARAGLVVEQLALHAGVPILAVLAAALTEPDVGAAIRSVHILLGPVAIVSLGIQSVLLPELGRTARSEMRAATRGHLQASFMAVGALLVGIAVLAYTLTPLGRWVLGDAWPLAAPVISIAALQRWLMFVSVPAFATLKVSGRTAVNGRLRVAETMLSWAGAPLAAGGGAAAVVGWSAVASGAVAVRAWLTAGRVPREGNPDSSGSDAGTR